MKNNDTIYSSLWLEKQCGTLFNHILNYPPPPPSLLTPPKNLIERNKPLGGSIEDLQYFNKMSSFSEYIEKKHICISPHQYMLGTMYICHKETA